MKRQGLSVSLAELTNLKQELVEEAMEFNKSIGIDDTINYNQKWIVAIINKTPECCDTWELEI